MLIKQSSLGDLIHCFPAISDAYRQVNDLQLDWLVEENFADVPTWHQGVYETITIALRKWRSNFRQSKTEINEFLQAMRERQYDVIIDAQALIKSSLVARLINKKPKNQRAKIVGLDKKSIRTEKLCTLLYHQKVSVPLDRHAIERVRRLFAAIFEYDYEQVKDGPLFPHDHLNFPHELIDSVSHLPSYIVGVHATTWQTKHLPIELWHQYAKKIQQQGKKLVLPWYGQAELENAKRIQAPFTDTVIILPQLNLNQIVSVMKSAEGVISVDTGYAHIAAAMNVPIVTLYGATSKYLTSALGDRSDNLQSSLHCSPCMQHQCQYSLSHVEEQMGCSVYPPCYKDFSAEIVWDRLQNIK